MGYPTGKVPSKGLMPMDKIRKPSRATPGKTQIVDGRPSKTTKTSSYPLGGKVSKGA